MSKKWQGRLFVVNNCKQCPNHYTKRTPGAGYAEDHLCKAVPEGPADKWPKNNTIAGYVEWSSEGPQDGEFPKFCPLKKVGK
jgi:hypothetical protein